MNVVAKEKYNCNMLHWWAWLQLVKIHISFLRYKVIVIASVEVTHAWGVTGQYLQFSLFDQMSFYFQMDFGFKVVIYFLFWLTYWIIKKKKVEYQCMKNVCWIEIVL